MLKTDEKEMNDSLRKARGVCRASRVFFAICFVVCAIVWISIVGLGLFSLATGEWPMPFHMLVYGFVYDAGCVVMFLMLMRIFSDVGMGKLPFSQLQSRRLWVIALVALLLVFLELFYTAGLSYVTIPELGYGIVMNDGTSEPTVNLNVGMLVFSGIMYSLSAIFRYAALLQQLSDDTV